MKKSSSIILTLLLIACGIDSYGQLRLIHRSIVNDFDPGENLSVNIGPHQDGQLAIISSDEAANNSQVLFIDYDAVIGRYIFAPNSGLNSSIGDIEFGEDNSAFVIKNSNYPENIGNSYNICMFRKSNDTIVSEIIFQSVEDASVNAENFVSIRENIEIIQGIKYGEFGVVPDSLFIEKWVDRELVWEIVMEYKRVLQLDNDPNYLYLTTAKGDSIVIESINIENSNIDSRQYIDVNSYFFAPLIFRNPLINTTFLVKFTNSFEVSAFDGANNSWTYLDAEIPEGNYIDRILHLETDSLNNIYLLGIGNNELSGSGIILVKLNRDGDLVWRKTFNGPGIDQLWSSHMIISKDKMVISGQFSSNSGIWNQHLLLVSLEEGILIDELSIPVNLESQFNTKSISNRNDTIYIFGVNRIQGTNSLELRILNIETSLSSVNNDLNTKKPFLVYPNPSGGLVHINLVDLRRENISVFDKNGIEVSLKNIRRRNNIFSFEVDKKGLFFVKVLYRGKCYVDKIIVQ